MEKIRKYGFAVVVAAILLLTSASLVTPGKNRGFLHGIMINVDVDDYYLEGVFGAEGGVLMFQVITWLLWVKIKS